MTLIDDMSYPSLTPSIFSAAFMLFMVQQRRNDISLPLWQYKHLLKYSSGSVLVLVLLSYTLVHADFQTE
jgi:hypothetical protein